jgi:iron(III) transport system permease protein
MGLVLATAALPIALLLTHMRAAGGGIDASSLVQTLGFAAGGAVVATVVGATAGMLAGTLALPGGRWWVAASCVLIAAPPAFWWLGATRVPGVSWGSLSGPVGGALVAGVALSPIPLLLVHAALREMPANLYESARVMLPPLRRLLQVLIPLMAAPLWAGFLLTVILLLGESEIPFLFGFRTAMTDIVTLFSQTFDVRRVIPLVTPLLLVVLGLGALAGRPLLRTVLASSRGAQGVVRRPDAGALSVLAAVPAAVTLFSIGGYALAVLPALARGWPGPRLRPSSVLASVGEPVVCAWSTVTIVVAAAYAIRSSAALRWSLWAGLLLFCTPGGIHGIGWIGVSQALGGLDIPPGLAHASRVIGLPLLGFAIAYSRLPRSLEDAARLLPISPARRALVLSLPLLAPSLVAAAALVAALVFADRDVASLLLAPGASRLMLDLYLVSANAPSAAVGAAALVALAGATLTVALAAAGPLLLWRRRG